MYIFGKFAFLDSLEQSSIFVFESGNVSEMIQNVQAERLMWASSGPPNHPVSHCMHPEHMAEVEHSQQCVIVVRAGNWRTGGLTRMGES